MEIPKGFWFAATASGIKKEGLDLGLILSERPAEAAGVFTTNIVKAAPVLLAQKRLATACPIRAILVNSGCANACTGKEGLADAEEILARLASLLEIAPEEILPASTGVIGQRLPVTKIKEALKTLSKALDPQRAEEVARAMMTTDTFPKMETKRLCLAGGREISLLGLAKGAGMIAPRMATMLAFILTDAALPREFLQESLREAVENSFNRITVDGDTSTNDTVYLLANGASGQTLKPEDQALFKEALTEVCQRLAYLIVKDGEGATKVVRVRLVGARDDEEAFRLGKTVAESLLVKTAFFGEDPNWGRILAAMGRSGVDFAPERVDIFINGVQIVENGLGKGLAAERKAHEEMKNKEFSLTIHLKEGNGSAEILTCDLSYEYVKINAEYRT